MTRLASLVGFVERVELCIQNRVNVNKRRPIDYPESLPVSRTDVDCLASDCFRPFQRRIFLGTEGRMKGVLIGVGMRCVSSRVDSDWLV